MLKGITNRITLHGADQEEIDKVIDFLRSEKLELDFNNIIPMPEEIRKTMFERDTIDYAWEYYQAVEFENYTELDKMFNYAWVKSEYIKTREELLDFLLKRTWDIHNYGKHLYDLEKKYGCHDWYDWCCKNWGAEWNVCDARREGNIIVFITAGGEVTKLMRIVSEKFPNVTLDYEFADEYFGYHVGRYTFVAGIVMAEYEPIDNTIESKQLSKSILGWEPSEDFDNTDDVA